MSGIAEDAEGWVEEEMHRYAARAIVMELPRRRRSIRTEVRVCSGDAHRDDGVRCSMCVAGKDRRIDDVSLLACAESAHGGKGEREGACLAPPRDLDCIQSRGM